MKIVIAPGAFKESLAAGDVARAMAEGVLAAVPGAVIELIPLADGGSGTVRILAESSGGRMISVRASGPLGKKVDAHYALLGDGSIGAVETASASGLDRAPIPHRNPLRTTSYGTGEIISRMLKPNPGHLIVCVGDTATNDGGTGLLQALGVRFFDQSGHEIRERMCGGRLGDIGSLGLDRLHPGLAGVRVTGAVDVLNPLLGETGCLRVYGAQKGATSEMQDLLESGMRNFAEVLSGAFGKPVSELPGAGAGGGIGAALATVLNAPLTSGIDLVMEWRAFHRRIAGADLILTGEGFMDRQTLSGKTVHGVTVAARKQDIPVIGIAGRVSDKAMLLEMGLKAVYGLADEPIPLERMLADASHLIRSKTEQIVRKLMSGQI
ncbi:glycerate kinase [bacterium]|nr:glycerate kinase [candidate division CSSED10-310 bacterium]